MIQRKRTLQQSGIFVKQNPGETHFTMDELCKMATRNNSAELISKISRNVANIAGTNAYWRNVREPQSYYHNCWKANIFFTFSSADMHWPDLHALFQQSTGNTTSEERQQNIINNPHIVDWFFTQWLENFIKHWLYMCTTHYIVSGTGIDLNSKAEVVFIAMVLLL